MCLTVRLTSRTDAKAGLNDPLLARGSGRAYRIKVTPGIQMCPVLLYNESGTTMWLITVEPINWWFGLTKYIETINRQYRGKSVSMEVRCLRLEDGERDWKFEVGRVQSN